LAFDHGGDFTDAFLTKMATATHRKSTIRTYENYNLIDLKALDVAEKEEESKIGYSIKRMNTVRDDSFKQVEVYTKPMKLFGFTIGKKKV
jgi:hypothetical protein